jgi:hypothetical protein
MKKFIFTAVAVALVCSAGMFSSCSKSDEDDNEEEVVYNPATDGIIGKWVSGGTNVAPLLIAVGLADTLSVEFGTNTYHVDSYFQGTKMPSLDGTYVQRKSTVGNIWTITLNQTSPGALTSEGIFEITKVGDIYTLDYEVVQTEPSLGAPPTPEDGFGSSAGGILGNTNIQKYVRIAE